MGKVQTTKQMNQWLDLVQEYLEDIEREVATVKSVFDLDIEMLRNRLARQYQLLQVLRDVATGRKILVGVRQDTQKIQVDESND